MTADEALPSDEDLTYLAEHDQTRIAALLRLLEVERRLPGRRIAWQWRLFGFAGRWFILTPARRRHLEAERGGRQEPRLGRW